MEGTSIGLPFVETDSDYYELGEEILDYGD